MSLDQLLIARINQIEAEFFRLEPSIRGNPNIQLEIEARFHEYFQPHLSRTTFTTLRKLEYLKQFPVTKEVSQDFIYNLGTGYDNVHYRLFYSEDGQQTYSIIQKKSLLIEIEELPRNYGIKFLINSEVTNNSFIENLKTMSPNMSRNKTRYTYQLDSGVKLDLTEVSEYNYTKSTYESKYEAEIEFDRYKSNPNSYKDYIIDIWKLIHNSIYVYSRQEYERTITLLNTILDPDIFAVSPKYKLEITTRPLYQMRNLHYDDLTSPGLIDGKLYSKVPANVNTIGNPSSENFRNKTYVYDETNISYRITYKTDGERKLLFFTNEGTYLMSAPYSMMKIAGTYQPLHGTILEGEYVPKDKRQINAPDTKIWFFIYDALSITYDIDKTYTSQKTNSDTLATKHSVVLTKEQMKLGTDVQNKDHEIRISKCNTINQIIIDQKFIGDATIEVKEFGSPCVTLDNIFDRILRLHTEQSELGYKIDGFIFMPIQTGYKEIVKDGKPADKLPLNQRKLSSFPDVMKWKDIVTIDFRYVYENLKIEKIASDSLSGKETIIVQVPEKYDLTYSLNRNANAKNIKKLINGDNFYSRINKLYPKEDVFRGTELYFIINNSIKINFTNQLLNDVPSGTIVEMLYDRQNNEFIPIRIRDDKPKPNNQEFAEDNWKMISDPIDLDTLTGRSNRLMRKYHNRIKRSLFDYPFLKNDKKQYNLLDIASGKFGDINKMSRYKKVILVEPNLESIKEGINRIKNVYGYEPVILYQTDSEVEISRKIGLVNNEYFINEEHKFLVLNSGGENTELITYVTNRYFMGKADVISIMLGLTFFWNDKLFMSLVNTIRNNISPTGQFLFFTMDADSIFQRYKNVINNLSSKDVSSLKISKEKEEDNEWIKIIHFEEGIHTVGSQVSLSKNGVYIDLQSPTVDSQYENYVFLDDLRVQFIKNRFIMSEFYRADQEKFLNRYEKALSELYSYGVFEPVSSSDRNIIPSISLNIPLNESFLTENVSGDSSIKLNIPGDIKSLNPEEFKKDVNIGITQIIPAVSLISDEDLLLLTTETVNVSDKILVQEDKLKFDSTPANNISSMQNLLGISSSLKTTPAPSFDIRNIVAESAKPVTFSTSSTIPSFNQPVSFGNISEFTSTFGTSNTLPSFSSLTKQPSTTTSTLPSFSSFGATSFGTTSTLPSTSFSSTSFGTTTPAPSFAAPTVQSSTSFGSTSFGSTSFGSTSFGSTSFGSTSFGTNLPNFSSIEFQPIITSVTGPGNLLNMLSVSSNGMGDDRKEKLIVKNYSGNVVRIATIGDGNCLIHSVLKSFLPDYILTNNEGRRDIAQKTRNEMAKYLVYKEGDEMFYEWFINGNWLSLAVQQYYAKIKGYDSHIGFDASLSGLQKKFLSSEFLGDEAFNMLSFITKLTIIVVRGYTNDITFVTKTEDFGFTQYIVILGNEAHYELVAEIVDGRTKTIFSFQDQFIQSILK